jgi:hypothetical protein
MDTDKITSSGSAAWPLVDPLAKKIKFRFLNTRYRYSSNIQ